MTSTTHTVEAHPRILTALPPSGAAGAYSTQMNYALSNALTRSFKPLGDSKPRGTDSHLNTLLENAKAIFKVTTNTVAMHLLSSDWRARLFKQVDSLLDAEEWDEEDKPVVSGSSLTFIRMVIFLKARRPGLGATSDGNLVASWTTGNNRLTIVCKPDDTVRWVISAQTDVGCETAAGQTTILRLPDVLQPYNPAQWFSDEGR
ncbi:hypothetical protein NKJ86_14065 [Mesorhizobium sp. M0025]|uniref:hypothetical protein n=1 Tax=Mesorhizobium sp. M0025 TaxID=2956846 RepID=UPI00333666DA